MSVENMNSVAIAYLQAGDHRASIGWLQQALDRLRGKIHQGQEFADDKGSIPETNMEPQICVPLGPTEGCFREAICSDQAFCLFDRAFVIPGRACESKTCCVVLYNLALSHTLAWFQLHNSESLRLAIELYKMALSVVECFFAEANVGSQDDFVALMSMAVFNNLGYLQSQRSGRNDNEMTHHCMDAIQALMSGRDVVGPNKEAFLFFSLSSMFLFNDQKNQDVAPAA